MRIDPANRGNQAGQAKAAQESRIGEHKATVGGTSLSTTPKDHPLYSGGPVDFSATKESGSFSPESSKAQRFGWLVNARRW